jgi:hypothetical protein
MQGGIAAVAAELTRPLAATPVLREGKKGGGGPDEGQLEPARHVVAPA